MELEPLFTYGRCAKLSGLPAGALVTCAAVHTKFIALGTTAGTVHIFELGPKASGTEWRRIQAHQGRVLDISVDASGAFIGTAADDGTVVVASVLSDEQNKLNQNGVRAIRLAPEYARTQERPFMTGSAAGHLWMVRRSPLRLLGGHVENKVHDSLGEGPTRCVAWRGPLVAWANNQCVRVFDMDRLTGVMFISAPRDAPPADICPVRLCFESDSCLIVAWGNSVTVVAIKEKLTPLPRTQGDGKDARGKAAAGKDGASDGDSHQQAAGGAAEMVRKRYGETTAEFTLPDAYVAGVAPFGEELALLCYCMAEKRANAPGEDADGASANRPPGSRPAATTSYVASAELRVVTRDNVGRAVYRETLPLRGLESTTPAQLSLVSDAEHVTGQDGLPILFVTSPGDVVAAQPRGTGDHVEWLVSRADYEPAVAILTASPDVLPPDRRRAIVGLYVKSLIDGGDAVKAAAACVQLLRRPSAAPGAPKGATERDTAAWERWLRYALDTCSTEGKAHFATVAVAESIASGCNANNHGKASRGPGHHLPPLRLAMDTYESLLALFLKPGAVHDASGADIGPQTLLHAVTRLVCAPGETPPKPATALGATGLGDEQQDAAGAAGDKDGTARTTGTAQGKGTAAGAKALFGKAFGALGRPLAGLPSAASAGADASTPGGKDGGDGPNKEASDSVAFARKAAHLLEEQIAASEAAAAEAAEAEALERARVHPLYDVRRATLMVQAALRGMKAAGAPAPPALGKPVEGASLRYRTLLSAAVQLLHYDGRWEEVALLFLEEAAFLVPPMPSVEAQTAEAAAHRSPATPAPSAQPPALAPSPAAYFFDLLTRHALLPAVADRVGSLVAISQPRALALLCGHLDVFPPMEVATQIRSRQRALLAYLEALLQSRPGDYNAPALAPLHGVHLQLLGALDRARLLPFLAGSALYDVEEARRLCAGAKPSPLWRELVFVLSRQGGAKEAVGVLMDRLRDVRGACELASSVDDEEIWADLVHRAVRSGDGGLVAELLDCTPGTPLSPVSVIQQVPPRVRIPRLAQRLTRLLHDRGLGLRMVGATSELMRRDFMGLIGRLIAGQQGGLRLDEESPCALCSEPVHAPKARSAAAEAVGGGEPQHEASPDGEGAGGDGANDDGAAGAPDASSKRAAEDPGATASDGGNPDDPGTKGARRGADDEPAPAIHAVVFFCRHAYHELCLRDYMGRSAAAAAAANRDRGRSTASRASFASYGNARRRTSSVTGYGAGAYDSVDRAVAVRGKPSGQPPGRAQSASAPRRDAASGTGSTSGMLDRTISDASDRFDALDSTQKQETRQGGGFHCPLCAAA